MKISTISNNQNINKIDLGNAKASKQTTAQSIIEQTKKVDLGKISFRGFSLLKLNFKKTTQITDKAYENADKYLNNVLAKAQSKSSKQAYPKTLLEFDLKKLDGIQNGIKVFEGLSIKQIAYMLMHLDTVAIQRGCSGRCACCIMDAKPIIHNPAPNMITRMSWEDFNEFHDGLSELGKRIGINPFNVHPIKKTSEKYLFFDADAMELQMFDKNRKSFDFTDAADLMYEKFGLKNIFDTSGWVAKNEKMQQRAEKFVEYFKTNHQKYEQLNISVNPFFGLNHKSVKYLKENNIEKYQKMRNLYTDRMANVIYTFTPLINLEKFNFISRSFSNGQYKNEQYTESALRELCDEIVKKVEQKYNTDILSTKKIIKTTDEISKNIETIKEKLYKFETVVPYGRAKDFYPEESTELIIAQHMGKKPFKINEDIDSKTKNGLIDANGNYYIESNNYYFKTDMKLNFENKDKITPTITRLNRDFTVKKQQIENEWDYKV